LSKKKKDEGPSLTIGLNAINVTNRVNFAGYVGNLSSPFFGQAVATRPAHRLQLSFQLAFYCKDKLLMISLWSTLFNCLHQAKDTSPRVLPTSESRLWD